MFPRDQKIRILNRILNKQHIEKIAIHGSNDGDLKAKYNKDLTKKDIPGNSNSREQGPQSSHKGNLDHSIQRDEKINKKKKKKIKSDTADLDVPVHNNGHKSKHRKTNKPKIVDASKNSELFQKPDYSSMKLFDDNTTYFSDYCDKDDIKEPQLEEIVDCAKNNLDPIFDKSFTLDESAQNRVKYEDALDKAIWEMDKGKYSGKVDWDKYQLLLHKIKDKTANSKVQQVVEKLLNTKDTRVEDKNTAHRILEKDFKSLPENVKEEVEYKFLSRDFYTEDPNLFPDPLQNRFPENIKASKLINLNSLIINKLEEISNLKKRIASKKNFNSSKDLKKLFGRKKKIQDYDLKYSLKKKYNFEDEEINSILDDAVNNGILQKSNLDEYTYKGGWGKNYQKLLNQENNLKDQKNSLLDRINDLYNEISEKENLIKDLEAKYQELLDDIELNRLQEVNIPEYTSKVFESDIKKYIHTLNSDGKTRSYKLEFIKRNDLYKPIFELTLYDDRGIDIKSLKQSANFFKQRIERLINTNIGYIDFDIEGDGIVHKDKENQNCYTKINIIFDFQLTRPEQIDTLKNQIEIFIHWFDDHFIN